MAAAAAAAASEESATETEATYRVRAVKAGEMIVYLETDPTLVERLVELLSASTGSLATTVKDLAPDIGIVKLATSISALPAAL